MISKIIGITGYSRSGKNTLGYKLRDFFMRLNPSYKIRLYAFADALKLEIQKEVQELFGINSFTEDTSEKEYIRNYLIQYGVDKRKEDPNYFLNIIDKRIIEDKCDISIITDVRFENEALYVLNHNGLLLKSPILGDPNTTEIINQKKIDDLMR